jgi:hypothetical protein
VTPQEEVAAQPRVQVLHQELERGVWPMAARTSGTPAQMRERSG